jgi:hypothetical protein
VAEFSAFFGLLMVEFSVEPFENVITWSDPTQAARKWRGQPDESAIEADHPIASDRAKPGI